MQKCTELGKNSMAWQHFVRFGQNNLKVKKGPNGHFLEKRCRDELQKSLPAKSFEELMAWVGQWLKRLDEKNGIVPSQEDSQQDRSDKDSESSTLEQEESKTPADPTVVDLCSDGEEGDSLLCFPEKETLDPESVISTSSLIILDDELGEVNLKDYADHVDGKLDADSLRQRNRKLENKANFTEKKQSSIKEFLTPTKSKAEITLLRSSLKTYVRKPKIPAKEEADDMASEKRSSLILRELNSEGGTNSNISFKGEPIPDLVVIDDISQEELENIENKIKPKTIANHDLTQNPSINEELNQIPTENEVSKSNTVIDKENPSSDPGICKEIKPTPDSLPTMPIKSETEVPLKLNGEAKENSEPSTTTNEEKKPSITMQESQNQEEVKETPVLTDIFSGDPCNINQEALPEKQNPNPIRVRNNLVPDVIRVRTDLLQEQVDRIPPAGPLNQLRDQVDRISPVVLSKAPGTAEKRRLPLETEGNQCESSSISLHGQPKRTAIENYNTASVTTSRPLPNIPVSAAPPNISNYQPVSPVIPTISSSVAITRHPPALAPSNTSTYPTTAPVNAVSASVTYPPVRPAPPTVTNYHSNLVPRQPYSATYLPAAPVIPPPVANSSYPLVPGSSYVTNNSYPSFVPPAPRPANTVWYPPPRYPPAVPVASQPVTTAASCNTFTTGLVPTSRYPPPNTVAPALTTTSIYQPNKPGPPAPVTSSSYQPNISVAPAPPRTSNTQLPMRDSRTDLTHIMGLLAQVEFYAYSQKNQEAFHLVNQLRISLQKGAASNGQAPQRNV
ncbi:proteoglycan 4 [Drosophila eugracilis]|uniref:proteoglycan 4 n=1 Tax=Drosophila eugracilis TaxID=29029 RepID=UPI0007E841B2|nr:proteoglycan 4 [Drosophila eugracilis]XP_017066461.1 proteoglycan 4 [Drosophila eugracilis]